jgi:hypothetical protein
MKPSKDNILVILTLLIVLFYGCNFLPNASENKTIPSNPDINPKSSTFRDPTTNEDFSCTMSFNKKQYIKGEPVLVKVKLTNHMDNDVTIRDCNQHYPFYSFEVSDPAWRPMKLQKKLETSFTNLNPEFKIIEPNQSYDIEINLADWYDFSQIGRYSVKANWCCFIKRAPYERHSVISDIIIVSQEPKEWFDPNKIPIGPIWFGVPDDWSKNILREKLTTFLRVKIKHDFNDLTISTKDDVINLAYHSREYNVERPESKALTAKKVLRKETGPQPDGLILDVWLDEHVGQLERPQLLDMTYWKLYATELYLPEMKLYLYANINYGAKINKDVLTKYMNLAGWMDDISGTKAKPDTDK